MKTGDWHVIEQGESVESIASECRHALATIWDAPENNDLKEKRKDPHVLMPGDRIFIPPIETKTFTVSTGTAAKFQVDRPPSRLVMTFLDSVGKARANLKYVLRVDGRELNGTTDGSGKIDPPIPARAKDAELELGEGDEAQHFTLNLRHLDPVTEVTGAQARLRNLGYDVGPIDGEIDARFRAALAAFQRGNGIEPTGELDATTQSTLIQKYGC